MKYRWRFNTRKGSWHPTRREAEDSAIKQGLGSREEWGDKRFYRLPGVEIEERE